MKLDHYIYESGLIASGCWDKFDDYDKQALEKFAQFIVQDVISIYNDDGHQTEYEQDMKVLEHFGME